MAMNPVDVLREALQLSEHERMELAEALIQSVPDVETTSEAETAEFLSRYGSPMTDLDNQWGGPLVGWSTGLS